MMYLAAILDFIVFLFCLVLMCFYIMIFVKYKIFLSAMEYLPFSPGDGSKGSFEEIMERYLYHFFVIFL
jgi:hypothetical protein